MFIPKTFGSEGYGACWNDCSTIGGPIAMCAPGCVCLGTNRLNNDGVCFPRPRSWSPPPASNQLRQDNQDVIVHCLSHNDCSLDVGSTTTSFCFRTTGSEQGFCVKS
ncbi:hypothetical protein LIER_12803 [Lithospermum erythrorhizon]|uniref:Uncharacterized protein n=1 Tax=Lithospermum erythrorhizon TaxID=34254 RepID=A0AAV3PVK7_LITER